MQGGGELQGDCAKTAPQPNAHEGTYFKPDRALGGGGARENLRNKRGKSIKHTNNVGGK